MAEMIYATIVRGKNNDQVVPYAVYLLMDKLNAREAADYQGSDPHFTVQMHTFNLPVNNVQLVQLGDLVIDTKNIDPKTNNLRQFRIISDPEPSTFAMSWRWVAIRPRGA